MVVHVLEKSQSARAPANLRLQSLAAWLQDCLVQQRFVQVANVAPLVNPLREMLADTCRALSQLHTTEVARERSLSKRLGALNLIINSVPALTS